MGFAFKIVIQSLVFELAKGANAFGLESAEKPRIMLSILLCKSVQ